MIKFGGTGAWSRAEKDSIVDDVYCSRCRIDGGYQVESVHTYIFLLDRRPQSLTYSPTTALHSMR